MNKRKYKIKTIVEQVIMETGLAPTVAANAAAIAIKNQVDANNTRLDMPFNLPSNPNESDIARLSPSEQRRYEDKKLRDDARQYISMQQTLNPSIERDRERVAARINDPNSIYGRNPSLMTTSSGAYPNEKGVLDYPSEEIGKKIEQEIKMREQHRKYELEMKRNNAMREKGIEPPPREHPHPDPGIEAMYHENEKPKDTI